MRTSVRVCRRRRPRCWQSLAGTPIGLAILTLVGLIVGVVVPMVLPGPKLLTITLGSGCFVLIVVIGSKLLRRILIPGN